MGLTVSGLMASPGRFGRYIGNVGVVSGKADLKRLNRPRSMWSIGYRLMADMSNDKWPCTLFGQIRREI